MKIIDKARNGFTNLFAKWNEFVLSIILIAIFPATLVFYRFIDETAAALDIAAVLQPIYIACLVFSVLFGFIWVGMMLNFPTVYEYFEKYFVEHFKCLVEWQKILISLFVFFALFFAVILLYLGAVSLAG